MGKNKSTIAYSRATPVCAFQINAKQSQGRKVQGGNSEAKTNQADKKLY